MNKKIKILTISDHPLFQTGVAIQTRLFAESMLQTGDYELVSLAGALRHEDKSPMRTEQYGDDWRIYPIENYGNEELLRSAIQSEKPDIVWIMTDPRYWTWLWQMEEEIRSKCSLVYYHVWDNYPVPLYNKKYYDSNDLVVSASKLTYDVVSETGTDSRHIRIPHTFDPDAYKKLPEKEVQKFKSEHFGDSGRTIFFFNNRNIQRKNLSSLLWWYKEYLDECGDNSTLLIHTDPNEPSGANVEELIRELNLNKNQIMVSPVKYSSSEMAMIYNCVDCTINISEAEGFGLSTLESLACGTPIIVTNTGGLKEQWTDGKNKFGFGIDPAVRTVVGSQSIPYIYQDRINKEQFISSLKEFCSLSKEERQKMSSLGQKYVIENYSLDDFSKKWDTALKSIYSEKGSWESRNHQTWGVYEI